MIAGATVMLGGNTPPLLDNNLLRMDEILFGAHPSFMLGRLAATVPGLRIAMQATYQLLALALTGVLALACRYPARLSVKSALAIVLYPAALSEFVYLLCPAAGPKYVYAVPLWRAGARGDRVRSIRLRQSTLLLRCISPGLCCCALPRCASTGG